MERSGAGLRPVVMGATHVSTATPWRAIAAACSVLVLGACGSATSGSGDPTVAPATSTAPVAPTSAGTLSTSGATGRATTPSLPGAPTTPPLERDPTDPPIPSPTSPTTLSGIPEPGVEVGCVVLDGYVLLGGDRTVLRSGRAVTVVGHTEPGLASTCQQGRLLVVDSVTPGA